jgi:hypothetical protein
MAITTLAVAGHAAVLGTCELCMERDVELTETVSIQRDGSALASLQVCQRCGRALRRLSALFGPAGVASAEVLPEVTLPAGTGLPPVAGVPRLVHQFGEHVLGGNGHEYAVAAYADVREDGTWVGWLVFTNILTGEVRSTRSETTQPNLGAVTYWATGVEPTYLEGAFGRATSVIMPAPGGLYPSRGGA